MLSASRDTGSWVTDERLLISHVLFSALLALEVHRFLGEANLFPKFSWGSFVASASKNSRCTLNGNLHCELQTFNHPGRPRLGSIRGNLCKATVLSLYLVLPHTIHRSPGMSGSPAQQNQAAGIYVVVSTRRYSCALHRLDWVYGNPGSSTVHQSCCFLHWSI